MKKEAKNRSFTLIELLVVIAIIGLLASIVLVSLDTARAKARDTQRIAAVKQLMTALELYYDTHGHYPITDDCNGSGSPQPNKDWCNSVQTLSDGHWIKNNENNTLQTKVLAPFIAAEPIDPTQGSSAKWLPQNGGTIFYHSAGHDGPGQWYMIVFGLENYPHPLEKEDGVTACDGTHFDYGEQYHVNGIITIGASCPR